MYIGMYVCMYICMYVCMYIDFNQKLKTVEIKNENRIRTFFNNGVFKVFIAVTVCTYQYQYQYQYHKKPNKTKAIILPVNNTDVRYVLV